MHQTSENFDYIREECGVAPKMIGEKVFFGTMGVEMADDFAAWYTDDAVSEGTGQAACIYDADVEAAVIASRITDDAFRCFAIYDREDFCLIGECSLRDIDPVHRTATLGVLIGERDYRGSGRGRESVSMLLDFAFDVLNLRNVGLQVHSFNEDAIKCYESVGFQEFGRRHECFWLNGEYWDTVYMEMTSGRWKELSEERSGV